MSRIKYMWYGTKPTVSFTPNTTTQTEGFEAYPDHNTFFTITNPSTMSGTNFGWKLDETNYAHTGTRSFRSADMESMPNTPQYARVDFSFVIPPYARNIQISYWYYQDCETGYDGLKVYFDGKLVHNHIQSGVYGYWTWDDITTAYTGSHVVTFEYYKDGATDGGVTDAVYIDDLTVSYDVDTIGETPGSEIIRFDGSTGYYLMYHRVGAQAPPVSLVEQRIPLRPGAMFQYMDIQPRDVELGILVKGNDPSDLRTKVRDITTKLIGVDGTLYARYTDGSERRLYCMYKEGLEGEETSGTMGAGYFQKIVLVFRAFDPFWYETSIITSRTADQPVSYQSQGDYDAYPVIFVDGACTNPDIAIWKTGGSEPTDDERLKINSAINNSRRLIVDMKHRTVKLDDGTNLYGSIDSTSNKFNSIPNDGGTYYIDVEIDEEETDGHYHVYIETPYWGV